MTEFRWIKASLCLILVLQFTAATGQRYPYFTVRDGDEVTLPCDTGTDDQRNCDSTDWLLDDLRSPLTVYLFREGQIDDEAKDKSDRLSVSENCSLVIKKVTDEDIGKYTCKQFRSGQQEGQNAVVILSVVTIPLLSLTMSPSSPVTEHKDTEEVTVICSVSTYLCVHTVKWLIEGQDVDKDHKDLMTSQSSCSASLTFMTFHFFNTSRFNSLICEVTFGDKVQKFPFRNSPSGGETDTTTTTTPTATSTNEDNLKSVWRYVIGAVVLVALLIIIIIVAVIKWKRTNGNTKRTDGTVADPEEGVSYASVSFAKKTKKTNNGAQADPEEGVSYASVNYTKKTKKTKSGAQADPEEGVSYASVNYTKKTKKTKSGAQGRRKHGGDDEDEDAVTYASVNVSSTIPSSLSATITNT
ncbi:uncharacterized protein LOC117727786 isoform X3 [Cyclopterus lumpus]|uniref:uncharacterized protein LOC117727786 isoform X3 n=1 Tax=Cyclopterus lumpus TaxID=8103 RepID=UPI001487082F|nr:uncharacterized protein LOC117727786 isoform X3 [Cyclopterus lumpus]